MIQISKKFKTINKKKALQKQNMIRKKYGLRPLKRLQAEMILYLQDDSREPKKVENIAQYHGGMYQWMTKSYKNTRILFGGSIAKQGHDYRI